METKKLEQLIKEGNSNLIEIDLAGRFLVSIKEGDNPDSVSFWFNKYNTRIISKLENKEYNEELYTEVQEVLKDYLESNKKSEENSEQKQKTFYVKSDKTYNEVLAFLEKNGFKPKCGGEKTYYINENQKVELISTKKGIHIMKLDNETITFLEHILKIKPESD